MCLMHGKQFKQEAMLALHVIVDRQGQAGKT